MNDDVTGSVTMVEGDRYRFPYFDHTKIEMPGDDHPGARLKRPQVRVWDGDAPCSGNVVAEAYLNKHAPDLVVEAWASGLQANEMLLDGIKAWAKQHGCKF